VLDTVQHLNLWHAQFQKVSASVGSRWSKLSPQHFALIVFAFSDILLFLDFGVDADIRNI